MIEIKTRIKNKHATEVEWNSYVDFIPLEGEFIIYDIDNTHDYTRIKIGDGKTTVVNLPFHVATKDDIKNVYNDLNDVSDNVAYINTEDDETITDVETGDIVNAVLYTKQTLTEEQKTQARENIGVRDDGGLTLSAIDLLIDILQHANYTEDMSSQIARLSELLRGGGSTDSDNFIITDDGNGNVIITASGSASITDDGNGNVTIIASGDASTTDDGNGNIVIA